MRKNLTRGRNSLARYQIFPITKNGRKGETSSTQGLALLVFNISDSTGREQYQRLSVAVEISDLLILGLNLFGGRP